jgi:hypothetical protein
MISYIFFSSKNLLFSMGYEYKWLRESDNKIRQKLCNSCGEHANGSVQVGQ